MRELLRGGSGQGRSPKVRGMTLHTAIHLPNLLDNGVCVCVCVYQ